MMSSERFDGVELDRIAVGSEHDVKRNASISLTIAADGPRVVRRFNRLSTLALCSSLMATWEAMCATMAAGLISGGPVSLVYGFVVAFIGTMATALSLSECCSMCPTAGGQYHYVASLSPPRMRNQFTWAVGWITTFAWQATAASGPFLVAGMIQGLLVLSYPEYMGERWHVTLLYWALVLFAAYVNIYLPRLLPHIENAAMTMHLLFFGLVLVALVVCAPAKQPATFVFQRFLNSSGWSSDGVAWSIGMLSATYVICGYDAATHLSEEVLNPRVNVPFAMIGSILINSALGFGFLLALLFCTQDFNAALTTRTGFPIIEIFYQATNGNIPATTAMTLSIVIIISLATIPSIASASRTLWAFARDSGLPFAATLSRVDQKHGVPRASVVATTILLALIGLLNIASTTAFTAVTSLAVVGLYTSYLAPVVLMLYQRTIGDTSIHFGPFRLGFTGGIVVNLVSIVYTAYTCIFLVFPPYQPVTALNFNFAPVILGAVLIASLVCWFIQGRKVFKGPNIVLEPGI